MNDLIEQDAPDRVDAAILEHLEAVDRGEAPDPGEFLARYADVAADLQSFFETARVVESMAGPTLAESTIRAAGIDTSRLADTWNPAAVVPSAELLQPPCRFGRYEVERKIGQGAMGAVYLAHDTQLSRQVALKIPLFDESAAQEKLDRFYREARATAQLRSPNLCPVYDVDQIDGVHFIAMAYIEGRTLSQWARDQQRSPREIAVVMRKVALAMQKAHDRQVIHRDLKPGNIMIDQEGEPVVMDFGLARMLGSDIRDTKVGAIVGSPAYMAPEQIAGQEVGPAADVYALGVALFELLAGRLPYQGSVISVIGQVLTGEAAAVREIQPHVDPRLNDICRRMMQKAPDERYASMHDVAAALTAYLNDALLAAGPPRLAELAPGLLTRRDPRPDDTEIPAAAPVTITPTPTERYKVLWSPLAVSTIVALVVFAISVCLYWAPSFSKPAPGESMSSDTPPAGNLPTFSSPAKTTRNGTASSQPAGDVADAIELRYNWKPGAIYGYTITIDCRREPYGETLTGTLLYRVVEASNDRTRLRFECRLSANDRSAFPGLPSHFHDGMFPPLSELVSQFPPRELTVDASGRVVSAGRSADLPFALGPLSELLIEPLPEGAATRWTESKMATLRLAEDRFPRPPTPFEDRNAGNSRTVDAKFNYEFASLDARQAKVIKRLSARVEGTHRFGGFYDPSVSGSGEFTFDRQRGVVTASQWSLRASERASRQVSITIRCRLLSEYELTNRFGATPASDASPAPFDSQHFEAFIQPPDPSPGQPVTEQTVLSPGDILQVHRMGRWYDARVLTVFGDGRCRVQLIGYGAESIDVVPRSRMRILNDQAAP